jgi:hypothetical protein
MIELDYRLHENWLKKAAEVPDFATVSRHFLEFSALGGGQIIRGDDYDCSLMHIYVPILCFAGVLFKTVVSLRESLEETMLYTLDENYNLHLVLIGDDVTVEEIDDSLEAVDKGRCSYKELLVASSDYARRVLAEAIQMHPRLAMNRTLREVYPITQLGMEHLLICG